MWMVVRLSMISEGMERIYRPTREVTDVVVQSCISLYFFMSVDSFSLSFVGHRTGGTF